MAKQRNYSTEFKRQVVLEYLAGETLYGLSKRHDVSPAMTRSAVKAVVMARLFAPALARLTSLQSRRERGLRIVPSHPSSPLNSFFWRFAKLKLLIVENLFRGITMATMGRE